MWYVAGYADGYHGNGYFDSAYDGMFRRVILKRLDPSDEVTITLDKLYDSEYYKDGVIGVEFDFEYSRILVAPHTGHAVKLYNYIEEPLKYSGMIPPPYVSPKAFVCSLGSSEGKSVNTFASDQLLIAATSFDIQFFGKCGSVVQIYSRRGRVDRMHTMYDLIRILSNRVGGFLPNFAQVHIYVETSGMTTSLKFDRSDEAKSYFSKMALEIVSR